MNPIIQKGLNALKRRYRFVLAVDVFLELAFILTAGVGALLLIDRLGFEFGLSKLHAGRPFQVGTAFAAALALAALVAPIAALARRIHPAGLAWRADKVLGAEERLLTSMEFTGGSSPFTPLVEAEAAEALNRAEPGRIVPWIPVGYRWGILVAVAAGTLLAAFPPIFAAPPIAGIIVTPLRGVAPLTVTCEDVSQGRITERRWEFGDGTKQEGFEVEHVFSTPGKFFVRLTVRGPGGTDHSEFNATVEVLDTVAVFSDFAADPRKGRAPLDVRFQNLSRNADQFAWDFGEGATSTDRDPVHRYEKPGLFTVTLDAKGGTKSDRTQRRAFIKVVGSDAPLADFRGIPRKGEAPLTVRFEDNSTGIATEWEWDFGDKLAGTSRYSRERNPVFEYRHPGRYTVRMKARGPGGEDVKVRERYIEVTADGDGPGGGGGGNKGGGGPRGIPDVPQAGKGTDPSKLFGKQTERPPVETKPETVPVQPKGDNLVEKVKNVVTPEEAPGAKPLPKTYTQAYGEYRRAAEDAMNREQIPSGLRDYVKKYFEQIRPK